MRSYCTFAARLTSAPRARFGGSGLSCSARQPGHDVAVVDLSAVDFFGSSGLSALVECRHAADELGLTLRVITAGPAVMRPLEGTGLVDCFDWYPTVDAALTEASSEEALPPDPAR